MNTFKTEQEKFWAGVFGDEYVDRNKSANLLASNLSLFSNILSRTHSFDSLIEFGANVGMNLHAIHQLKPYVEISAVEINQKAVTELSKSDYIKVHQQSILDFSPDYQRDFVLIKGVLIHTNPDYLSQVYKLLYRTSKRYICVVEYYNPTPVEVTYRGHTGKLFKRDFAGEIMDCYKDVRLLDYGFVYRRDPVFPQDDATWFLLEKTS